MGLDTKAFTFVGREFDNEKQAREYFKSTVDLTEEDLQELDSRLDYWLEDRPKQGYPECGLYSRWSGDENCGYYIAYNIYDSNPLKMIEKIQKASVQWKEMFKEEPHIIQAVLFS